MLTLTSSVEGRLVDLVHTELGIAPERIDACTPLAELGDSLDWVALLSAVEDVFGLRIDHAQSQRLGTVGDLVVLLQERQGA